MKKFATKVIAALLCLVLIIGLFPLWNTVYAAGNIADGYYTICSSLSDNKVIDIKDRCADNCTNIQLYTANSTTAQIFYIKHISDGYYAIVMAATKEKALDIHGGSGYCGANVEIYTYHGGANQLWKFVDTGRPNEYYIVSKSGGYYLDVSGGRTKDGTNIQVYDGNQTNAQRWKLKENYSVTTAIKYAKKYTDSSGNMSGTYNSEFNIYKQWNPPKYRGYDCTNYVSQCLFKGGLAKTKRWAPVYRGDSISDIPGGTTWVRSYELYGYLKDLGYTAETVNKDLSNIHLGDLVFFDNDGNGSPNHATICTNTDGGKPKFCAHSSWRKDYSYSVDHWDGNSGGKAYVVHMSFCNTTFVNNSVSSSVPAVQYFPKCASYHTSLVDGLKSVGASSSYSYRKNIALANGMASYSGTAAQNIELLRLLKAGSLIRP